MDTAPEHGGEEDIAPQPLDTTKCTDICGGDVMDHSFTRYLL